MKAGLTLLGFIFIAAVFAPHLTSNDPYSINLATKLQGPSPEHLLGTDENGGDLYARILFGARLSLKIALTVVFLSTVVGTLLGSLAGYYGGALEELIMRLIDMLQAFPGFLLALAIVAFIGGSVNNLILALSITGWTSSARLIRGEIQSLKSREFVSAALALGASNLRILIRHLWPNCFALLSVQVSFNLAAVVISEAGLSFLGLGAPPNEPSWGALLGSGRKYLIDAPHVSLFPGLAIIILVLGFNLLGDGLRRHYDPHS